MRAAERGALVPVLGRAADRCTRVLSTYSVRLVMSVLILVSLTPAAWVDAWWFVFFGIFGVELAMRAIILLGRHPEEVTARRRVVDVLFFGCDLIALLSFLPLHWLPGGRYLRLPRFLRLFMLLGYWGPALRSLFVLLTRPERRLQIWLLTVAVAVLSFVSATLLAAVGRDQLARELGIGGEITFVQLWWWSFRQLQDPGNLIQDVRHLGIAVLSIVLTGCGLFMISFLIGVGTSVVEELVEMTRDRALGLRGHSVIVNADAHTHFFLEAVGDYYRKQLQRPRWMVLGPDDDELRHELESRHRGISYRRGDAFEPEDLARVDAKHAKRIVVVSDQKAPSPDAATVSVLLAARRHNVKARLYAEILDERHASAFFNAGGENTVLVPTEHMLALAIANVAVLPSSLPIFDELLSSHGAEIYTYMPTANERCARIPLGLDGYRRLQRATWERAGVTLIGLALAAPDEPRAPDPERRFVLLPEQHPELLDGARLIVGYVAIAPSFESLARVARAVALGSLPTRPLAPTKLECVDLVPCRESAEAGRYLITGLLARTTQVIEHLFALRPAAKIWWMVESAARVEEARDRLLESGRSIRRFGEAQYLLGGERGTFDEIAPDTFVYRDAAGVQRPGRVHLITGDWSSRDSLLEPRSHGYSLDQIERILIQAGAAGGSDPDALGVMAVMKLENLACNPSFSSYLARDLHVVLDMVDADKAALIRDRAASGDHDALAIEVLPSEQIRNVLLFHSTVVPGFAPIFLAAFGSLRLARFLVSAPGSSGAATYGELSELVAQRTGGALIGAELADGSHATILPPAHRIALKDLRAVFVLGATTVASAPSDPSPPACDTHDSSG